MHIPPRVMVLMFMPIRWSATSVPSSDSGMATTEMTVVRKLPRNRKSVTMTNSAPSTSARPTLPTDASMKSAWRKMRLSMVTSGGSDLRMSSRLRSMFSVTRSVLTLGCLDMDSMTQGLAQCDA